MNLNRCAFRLLVLTTQVSKGPQENDRKLGGHSNFGVGHQNFTEISILKIESKVLFSPASPVAQKGEVAFCCS